jgi:O-antigen/teichoic acid export membrane protein
VKKGRGGFVGNVLALSGGTAVAQALTVLAAPVLSRLFLPSAFGLAAVYRSIVESVAMVGCLAYHPAIMLPERDEDAVNLLWACALLTLGVTGLAAVLLVFWGGTILDLVQASAVKPIMFLIPIGIFLSAIPLPLRFWHSRLKRFKPLATFAVFTRVSSLALILTLGFLGFQSGPHLICGRMLGFVVGAALLAWLWWRHDLGFALRNFRLSEIRRLTKQYKKFPLVNSWAMFADRASVLSPPLLMSAFFGSGPAGQYSQAIALLSLPFNLISRSIGHVFYERAAAAKAAGKDLGRLLEHVANRLGRRPASTRACSPCGCSSCS